MNKTTHKIKLHHNSQKRYYIKNAIYFITTNTLNGYPYFENDVLCELFVYELNWCKKIHGFKIHGYKLNPEHVHLLIQPIGKYNYSEIIHSLKRNMSRNINIVFGYDPFPNHMKAGLINPAFKQHVDLLHNLRKQFIDKYGSNHNIPKFKWQLSFYDHIIRNDFDHFQHLKYIQNQWIKHELPSNKWCWVIGQ